jgi:signal transduction histidine kinase
VSDHEALERAVAASAVDLREIAAQRGSFLGFVAHEMRNPLSTALWSAELLARLSSEDRGGARGEKLTGMCLRALQRLRSLVEDHFLAERLDVGGIPFRLEAVLVREAVAAVATKVGVAELALEIEEGLAVRADRGILERVLDGLLATAGRGGSPVQLDAGRTRDTALLRVRGAPPAPDALELPQKGTASDPTGRALALYTALRAAQALGGSLSTTQEEYLLVLPLASTGSPAAAT